MGLSERHTNAARPPGSPLAGRWPYLGAQKSHRISPNFWPPKRACVDTSRSCGFRVASSLMFVGRRPCERHQWWSSLLHLLGSSQGRKDVVFSPLDLDTVEPSGLFYWAPTGYRGTFEVPRTRRHLFDFRIFLASGRSREYGRRGSLRRRCGRVG